VCVIATFFAGEAWSQRAAYRHLRGAKQIHGRIVDFVANESEPGGYVLTDLWWLDQIAAALAPERRFLYVDGARTGAAALALLHDGGVRTVTMVTSRAESGSASAEWTAASCYAVYRRREIPERALTAVHLRSTC
jgi:hypothetical protein